MQLDAMVREHLDAGEQQEGAEHIEDPFEALDERDAKRDHGAAQNHGSQDAPEQHPVLVGGGHREVAEQHDEHEDVVHAQRVLDEVAGQEFHALLVRPAASRQRRHHQRQRDEHDRGQPGFPQRDRVCAAIEDPQVQRQDGQHRGIEGNPEPERGFHGWNRLTANPRTGQS
jgi:hypothetical protein